MLWDVVAPENDGMHGRDIPGHVYLLWKKELRISRWDPSLKPYSVEEFLDYYTPECVWSMWEAAATYKCWYVHYHPYHHPSSYATHAFVAIVGQASSAELSAVRWIETDSELTRLTENG